MFKREYLSSYLKWGILAALVFCIPMIIFLSSRDYSQTWWLFVGNGLFLVVIAAYMLGFNKDKGGNASTQTMVAAGHIATVFGIIISCIVAAIALPFFADRAMTDAPAETGTGATHGMVFFVFMNAIIGNVCGGSFSSLIIPYTAKRNQTKDKKSEVLNN